MKKLASVAIFLLAASILTGCQSPGRNPGGVTGSPDFDPYGGGLQDMDFSDGISMGGRFTGGQEYPGMFEAVYFGYDSSQVAGAERAKIETVANYLLGNPQTAVIVEGHTDERGSNEYNQSLGERRAQAVRSYLTSLGIEPDRIQTKSLGEESPADPGHTEAAWKLNRRGEFVLYY